MLKLFEDSLKFNYSLLNLDDPCQNYSKASTLLLLRNEKIQITLCKRIFECKNPYLSLLDYKLLAKVNVTIIFENTWNLQNSKSYDQYLCEFWELISNGFSKYFLTILGICKLNQTSSSIFHLLGIPKEILNRIGSFLNPNDFSLQQKEVFLIVCYLL